MVELNELNEIERHVFNECALQIAEAVYKRSAHEGEPQEILDWGAWASEWQDGCNLLKAIGLLRDCEEHFRLIWTVDQQHLRKHLETLERVPHYTPENFIGCFISLMCFDGHVSDERHPFEVAGYLHPAMWSLVEAGYASREQSGFQWSQKIAPIMIEETLWAHDGAPFSTQSAQDQQALGEKIWDSIPIWRRHWLAHRIVGMTTSDFFHYILMRWTGETLRHFEIPPPKTPQQWRMTPADLPAATRIVIDRLLEVRKGWRL